MATLKKFFALSTCPHCRRTREFLEDHHIPFTPVYVDKLQNPERDQVIEEQRGYNPKLSFPTLVFSDNDVIIGFRSAAISEKLGLPFESRL